MPNAYLDGERVMTNPAFYRSTRESAFTLVLTFAQIRALVEVAARRQSSNEYTRRNREIRGSKPLDSSLAYLDYEWPEFVDEDDGTGSPTLFGASPSERCLIEKGLLVHHRHQLILSRAGHLAMQMLRVSGHLQECTWGKAKVASTTSEEQA